MSGLPESWADPSIGEVTEVNPRKDVSLSNDDLVTFVPMAAVDEVSGTILSPTERQYREVAKGFTHFTDGDVIFAKITPSMENGKSAVARGLMNGVGIGSTEFHVFRSHGAIEPEYLWRFVRQKSFREDAQAVMSGAVGQQRVPTDYLKSHRIPLPPLPEQKRIVAKVDGLTARTARARTDLARIPTLIARYKQRLLALAFSGELTAGWRKANALDDFELVKLASLCLTITDGDHQAPPRSDSGIPFITIGAMNDGHIDLSKATRAVPRSYFDELKDSRRPAIGDVLFSVTGSIGIPALVETDLPFVFQRHISIMKPNTDRVSGRFLCYLLAAPQIREQVDAIATGTAQLTVPLGGLRKFDIPCPSLEEQAEITRRIESAFNWLDHMAADHAAAAKFLPKLDAAILAKAFRGELVPQDPNDESAYALLERIQAELAAMPKQVKLRKAPPPAANEIFTLPHRDDELFEIVTKKVGASAMTKSRQDDDVMGKPYLAALLKAGRDATAQDLFKAADLPVADFYKQLAWEIAHKHIRDSDEKLEAL